VLIFTKKNAMSNLFNPFVIKSVTFRNRIGVSPMCQYSATDGFANDWHLVHLGSRAVGGAGLVIMEATAVSPEGRISPQDLGIWKEEHIEPLKRITDFIHQQGAIAGIQIAHAGRKSSQTPPWDGSNNISVKDGGWQTIAPSAIAYKEGDPVPKEMSVKEIRAMVNNFHAAAERALNAGFRVLEIHAAHGYLINEFLSPISNTRTDEYGGSFERRIRFLTEIVTAVRTVWRSDLPLFVRISATDWSDGGWNEEDSVKLAMTLKEMDVDLIDCSSGGNVSGVRIPVGPLYQTAFAEKIKRKTGILTAAVGLITTKEEAEKIIEEGRADMVLMGREMLRNPYFPLLSQEDAKWPLQYERGKKK
jgi:2,4-dienoyl-CoA reductase-like NADH-dependent reductase (Old Yellow Enzyme family)